MSKLGFDDYIEPLTLYLHRYRETEGDRSTIRGGTGSASDLVAAPFMKRLGSLDYSALATGFAPNTASFHVAGHHHNGFFGYFKDAATATASGAGGGSSQATVANGEQVHGQYK